MRALRVLRRVASCCCAGVHGWALRAGGEGESVRARRSARGGGGGREVGMRPAGAHPGGGEGGGPAGLLRLLGFARVEHERHNDLQHALEALAKVLRAAGRAGRAALERCSPPPSGERERPVAEQTRRG